MSANDGVTPTVRAEALSALFRKLQAAGPGGMVKPAEAMVGAGDLLRRTRAAGLGESQVEAILAGVERGSLEAWLSRNPVAALEAALDRALQEGGEGGLGGGGGGRERWAS